mgnify:CR=1 FL=1
MPQRIHATRLILLAALATILGRSWRLVISYCYLTTTSENEGSKNRDILKLEFSNPQKNSETSRILSSQIRAQKDFQRLIHQTQNPVDCKSARVMASALEHPKDGFASEIQYVARLLQMAVSTQRILQFTPQWISAYEPPDCRNSSSPKIISGWDCLWKSVSSCSYQSPQSPGNGYQRARAQNDGTNSLKSDHDLLEYPLTTGILEQKQTSSFFDITVYGPNKVIWSPISFPRKDDPKSNIRADIIPYWERAFGRFWVRAQMAHYLWKPNAMLQAEITARMPPELISRNKNKMDSETIWIGFHIRYTDNIKDLHRHFSRDAAATRGFSRFMEFAEMIRSQHSSKSKPTEKGHRYVIYLATDNTKVVDQSRQRKWKDLGWEFITQEQVQRSDSQGERLWFSDGRGSAAGAIAMDIEVLRQADFLVGSFQSNVYRLAAELNTAWHVGKYPLGMQRHYTVDVEWYEDP